MPSAAGTGDTDPIKMMRDRLSAAPGKLRGWKAPAEVFREKVTEKIARRPCPNGYRRCRKRISVYAGTGPGWLDFKAVPDAALRPPGRILRRIVKFL